MSPSDPILPWMRDMAVALGKLSRGQRLALLWTLGASSLVIATWISFRLDLNFSTAASIFLVIIVLLSLLDSFASSAVFSIIGILSLNYFFVEPLYTLDVGGVQDVAALIAFLASSLAVTALVRRLRRMAEVQREQARLIELTNDAFIVRDTNGAITYWNRGAEELYGWKREDVIGRDAQKILRPTEPETVAAVDQMMLTSGRWEGELVHHRRDGSLVNVATRWSMQKDDRGQPISVLESNSDITERKRAEEAVRRSQAAYLAEAQKLSRTGSFGWNVATGAIHWSEETFRIFGYEETATPSLEKAFDRTHREDLDRLKEVIDQASAESRGFDHEFRLAIPDGPVKHVRAVGHPTSTDADTLHYIGAISDITISKEAYAALERSEQRYRDVFQRMPIGLVQLDAGNVVTLMDDLRSQGVTDIEAYIDAHPEFVEHAMDALIIEAANEHAAGMLGLRNSAAMTGPTGRYWRMAADAARRKVAGHFRGDLLFEEETRLTTIDGREIRVLFTVARSGANSAKCLAGFIDVTDRALAQEMLNDLQADFAHASRVSVLGELTASIAHEVNQPLAAIAANADAGLRWLGRAVPDLGELHDITESISSDARRAADIISRVRAMAGRRTPESALLTFDDIIAEALLFLRHEMQSHSVTVVQHLAANRSTVSGDRIQLQQVVVNLAVNSMQAMVQTDSPIRRIIVRSSALDDDTVRCTIEDSGPGIKPEHQSQLFESFFTTKQGGMGMGLPICKSIIEAHGGHISAGNNATDGGAIFWFTLPKA